jgi:hypothetical protein
MALLRYDPVQPSVEQPELCGYCTTIGAAPLGRRRFLGLTLATLGTATALPGFAIAAEPGKSYEAMLLTCIDPRFLESARHFMAEKHWIGKYSQFSFAGAAIGAVADKFESWHQTFWDNLAITIQLHGIKNLVALDHRDCGAAELAYGRDAVTPPKVETETHRKALAQFSAEVARHQPQAKLRVITGLISRDGKKVELFT